MVKSTFGYVFMGASQQLSFDRMKLIGVVLKYPCVPITLIPPSSNILGEHCPSSEKRAIALEDFFFFNVQCPNVHKFLVMQSVGLIKLRMFPLR